MKGRFAMTGKELRANRGIITEQYFGRDKGEYYFPCSEEKKMDETKKDEWTIKCSVHTYITLERNDKFIFCLDNDIMYAEEMIYEIEKRTKIDFENIKIKGQKEDFSGLKFFNGGWKRNFWDNFPSKEEIVTYIKLKYGKIENAQVEVKAN